MFKLQTASIVSALAMYLYAKSARLFSIKYTVQFFDAPMLILIRYFASRTDATRPLRVAWFACFATLSQAPQSAQCLGTTQAGNPC